MSRAGGERRRPEKCMNTKRSMISRDLREEDTEDRELWQNKISLGLRITSAL